VNFLIVPSFFFLLRCTIQPHSATHYYTAYERTVLYLLEEESNLKILFYEAKYSAAFGSIFPSVDICALIPNDEADVAILEEPEHLNWLRIPKPYKEKEQEQTNSTKDPPSNDTNDNSIDTTSINKKKKMATAKEKAELGWRFKFRHVVGIVHTNYKAYAEQFGIGGALINAPALCALNALVIRAYCHRVILLSGALPSLTPYKEVTCNVHGVRGEFLERPDKKKTDEHDHHRDRDDGVNNNDDDSNNAPGKTGSGGGGNSDDDRKKYAQVYFIGKLIWAKGFDKILDLENIYREKHNEYFAIDIYGSGGDEKAIQRSFYGRIPEIQRNDSNGSNDEGGLSSTPSTPSAEVFTWESSLRSHFVDNAPFKVNEKHNDFDDNVRFITERTSTLTDTDTDGAFEIRDQKPSQATTNPDDDRRRSVLENLSDKVVPVSVIGDFTKKALNTTRATSGAAVAVAKNVVSAGLNVTFTRDASTSQKKSKNGQQKSKPQREKLIFEPPQSVHEFRRNPIPARFLGSKDHVLIRDIAEHKIFLNMSITEVLCTTSAEALAMGKWVILPEHKSNDFFLQFPNCLHYKNLEECVGLMEYALAHDPKPLDDETRTKLSWEGANERLFESSTITKEEYQQWEKDGKIKGDDDAARFHVETGMKGQLIGSFFNREQTSKDDKADGATK